jgi:hypothetical protein
MEIGFYHESIGYWQAITEPSTEILDGYPEGTVSVPLKPKGNFEWDGSSWVPYDPPYKASDLTPRRFEYLLAYTGLDDVWSALEAELKTTNLALFAQIKAQRSASAFSQDKTLAFIDMFSVVTQQIAPEADLSEETIKAAWVLAEQVVL